MAISGILEMRNNSQPAAAEKIFNHVGRDVLPSRSPGCRYSGREVMDHRRDLQTPVDLANSPTLPRPNVRPAQHPDDLCRRLLSFLVWMLSSLLTPVNDRLYARSPSRGIIDALAPLGLGFSEVDAAKRKQLVATWDTLRAP